jgi:hypothetical protein
MALPDDANAVARIRVRVDFPASDERDDYLRRELCFRSNTRKLHRITNGSLL